MLLVDLLTGTGLAAVLGGWAATARCALRWRHRLHTDALTGLANRAALQRTLRRTTRPVALLMLDLDQFKPVNDRYGHRAGDAVLVEVARRLHRLAEPGEIAVRLHGDEFVLWLGTVTNTVRGGIHAQRRMREVAAAVAEPIHLGEAHLEVTASIGAAVYATTRLDDLLAIADTAMLRNKAIRPAREGGGHVNNGAHSATGVLAGVLTTVGVVPLTGLAPTAATLITGGLVGAGAALLPDLDHDGSTATRSGGWLTRGLAESLQAASRATFRATRTTHDQHSEAGHRSVDCTKFCR